MKPPKCRSCGKEEWRHVCYANVMPLTRVKLAGQDVVIAVGPTLTLNGAFPNKPKRGHPKTSTPEQRKAYLATKAKERRARQKAKA